MRAWLFLVVVCLIPPAWAAPVQIDNVRVWAAPDNTRVVFDLSAPVEHNKVIMLTDPFRAVIDIRNARLKGSLKAKTKAGDHYLQDIRTGIHGKDLRVVLDLKKFAKTDVFQLSPNNHYGNRLVVDLHNDKKDDKAAAQTVGEEDKAGKLRDVVIAIDAGHGGEDPGAKGPGGTCEKTVVLRLAEQLAALVNRQRGMRAILTRKGDYYLKLRKRIEIARKAKADMFISLHADSFRDPRVHGSSVYVLSQRGASSEHARWLAAKENASDLIGGVSLDNKDNVLNSVLLDLSQTASLEASIDVADRVLHGLDRVGELHNDRVESAAFAVLKSPDIPSILVETAYISNPREERGLRSRSHREKIARAILDGIRGYFHERPPAGTLLAEGQRTHVITSGETLSGIAEEYQVSLKQLRNTNSLHSDMIRVGQVLTIPNGS
ncbi:MAG: N-acetylmuramoyl-L-alanine amidase [Gammaproteobacteria bacterium]|jgi:N-acetylmuramoyl-L-alanine amidase